jgi:uncharacterized protein
MNVTRFRLLIWLKLIALIHIVAGISLACDWPRGLWLNYLSQLEQQFSITFDAQYNELVSMIVRLFGPTIASWGVLMLVLINQIQTVFTLDQQYALKKQMINGLMSATTVWFVLDTAISIQFGMLLHLWINSFAVVSIIAPCVLLKYKA